MMKIRSAKGSIRNVVGVPSISTQADRMRWALWLRSSAGACTWTGTQPFGLPFVADILKAKEGVNRAAVACRIDPLNKRIKSTTQPSCEIGGHKLSPAVCTYTISMICRHVYPYYPLSGACGKASKNDIVVRHGRRDVLCTASSFKGRGKELVYWCPRKEGALRVSEFGLYAKLLVCDCRT